MAAATILDQAENSDRRPPLAGPPDKPVDVSSLPRRPGIPYPSYADGEAADSLVTRLQRQISRTLWRDFSSDCDSPDTRQGSWLPYAWSAICQLIVTHPNNAFQYATGFLVTPYVVITAGHVINHPEAHRAISVDVTPGRGGDFARAGTLTSFDLRPCPSWNPASSRAEDDFAAIILPSAQFAEMGSFGFMALSNDQFQSFESQGGEWVLAGYPADAQCDQSKAPGTPWWDKGTTLRDRRLPSTLSYRMCSSAGQSGSPIYALDSQNRPVAVGIHTRASGGQKVARRLNSDAIQQINEWIATTPIA